jgi:hypothetical protein
MSWVWRALESSLAIVVLLFGETQSKEKDGTIVLSAEPLFADFKKIKSVLTTFLQQERVFTDFCTRIRPSIQVDCQPSPTAASTRVQKLSADGVPE